MSVAEAFPCLRQPFFFLFFFTSHGLRVFKANRQTRKEIDRTQAEDKRVLASVAFVARDKIRWSWVN